MPWLVKYIYIPSMFYIYIFIHPIAIILFTNSRVFPIQKLWNSHLLSFVVVIYIVFYCVSFQYVILQSFLYFDQEDMVILKMQKGWPRFAESRAGDTRVWEGMGQPDKKACVV